MLWSLPALPLLGFFLLLFGNEHFSRRVVSFIGVGMIALSFVMTLVVGFTHFSLLVSQNYIHETLFMWIPPTSFGFFLDNLSFLMTLVISFVATLIALYSVKFMERECDLARFFAAINLFVSAMLTLVLADNFLLLFAGWEGVGFCSYLLIGFWYEKASNISAANKAFVMTRLGDVFLLLGMALLFLSFGTLNIKEILTLAPQSWHELPNTATLACLFLLAGAIGKSAQIPLQTWLPDAMAGPTPVSALIHAATMVTAGVYLLARNHELFLLSPLAQDITLVIGGVTMLLGSLAALGQNDLKRVLAYSTMSQIGLMFMALGLGAYQAAMFHFTTHAFFKALLFLGAGAIGEALHHSYDMRKMGGLSKAMPFTFVTFLIGSAALSALPFLTSGFFSKELIMSEAYEKSTAWWAVGIIGAFFTALYTFRMVIMVFFGPNKHQIKFKLTWLMTVPLAILTILSVCTGWFEKPILEFLGLVTHPVDTILVVVASLSVIIGMLLAFVIFSKRSFSSRILLEAFGIDALYKLAVMRPYQALAHLLKNDVFSYVYIFIVRLVLFINILAARTQTGRLSQYLTVVIASAIAVMGFMVFS